MNVFILDPCGCALALAHDAVTMGHDVVIFIQDDPKTNRIGEGVVSRVRGNLEKWCRWADLVFVADSARLLHTFDKIRKDSQAKWFGPTVESQSWEMDRQLGQDLLARHDIPIAPYQIFSDYDAAIAYVKKRDTRLVSKPFGKDQENKALSYVAKAPEDLIFMLDRWKKLGKLHGQFMLQDFIEGVEFGIEGWFDGDNWAGPFHEAFEHKKLMNDEVGPTTGEMGTVNVAVKDSPLADSMLKPLQGFLKAHKFTGFFNINCIVDSKGKAWPLELTPRPGYPCLLLQLSICRGDFFQDLYTDNAPSFRTGVVTTGVVLAIPDFPYSHITRREVYGFPIFGWDEQNAHHHPCEMMKDRQGRWVTAGDYVACITGHGPTVSASKAAAYKNFKNLNVPNSPMYRTDIGDKVIKNLPKLHKVGLARSILP